MQLGWLAIQRTNDVKKDLLELAKISFSDIKDGDKLIVSKFKHTQEEGLNVLLYHGEQYLFGFYIQGLLGQCGMAYLSTISYAEVSSLSKKKVFNDGIDLIMHILHMSGYSKVMWTGRVTSQADEIKNLIENGFVLAEEGAFHNWRSGNMICSLFADVTNFKLKK